MELGEGGGGRWKIEATVATRDRRVANLNQIIPPHRRMLFSSPLFDKLYCSSSSSSSSRSTSRRQISVARIHRRRGADKQQFWGILMNQPNMCQLLMTKQWEGHLCCNTITMWFWGENISRTHKHCLPLGIDRQAMAVEMNIESCTVERVIIRQFFLKA